MRLELPLFTIGFALGAHAPRIEGAISEGLEARLVDIACGALIAGFVYFGALWIARRSRFSLMLAGMSGLAVLQAIASGWREVAPYDYPLHAVRLMAMQGLASAFAVLLAAYVAERFQPQRSLAYTLTALALAGLAAWLGPGFDAKTAGALLGGALAAAVAASVGARRGLAGAWRALVYLLLYVGGLFLAPAGFLDTGFFLVAALLMLVLMVGAVLRQWRQDNRREAALTHAAPQPDRLAVATSKGLEIVMLDEIQAILGADDYAELRLRNGRSLLHAATLDRLQASLPERFVRVHRSAIANLAHAIRLTRAAGSWRMEMSDGSALPVSRPRAAEVKARLAGSPAGKPT